jgi:hypothetical protein
MKPKPLASLNHFTVPLLIVNSSLFDAKTGHAPQRAGTLREVRRSARTANAATGTS